MDLSRHTRIVAQLVLGLGLLAVAAALYFFAQRPAALPAQASAAARSVSVVNGVTVVTLKVATQQQSGLRTEPLVEVSHGAETTASGTVLDLQPLFDLRSRHASAQAERGAALSAASASRAELERNQVLYRDDRNVSLKALQEAQAIYQSDADKAEAATVALRDIEATVRQQFGQTIARWALSPSSPEFARILRRADVLVRVTLTAGAAVKTAPVIQVQPASGGRSPAYLVSGAAQSAPGLAGIGLIYRVPAPLPGGSSVTAFVPATDRAEQGVLVPAGAVVWYADQPWVYVQTGQTTFARRPIGEAAVELEGGLFVAGVLKAGDRVVARGAQLLLSEEQKPPPSGGGCKDPECD